MWDSNGIRPDTSPFGTHSKSLIYCCPVPIDHKDCPDGCMMYNESAQVLVTLDFHMIMDDGYQCFYGYDGCIAIQTKRLGVAYVESIIDLGTGALMYYRNSARVEDQRLPAIADLEDSAEDRKIETNECFICGNQVWIGCTSCFHCNSPVLYDQSFPMYNPNDSTLPPACTRAWTREEGKVVFDSIIKGRKAVAKSFEMKYNINTDIPKEERASEIREMTRSYPAQGERCDQDLCKADRLPHKDENLADSIRQLKEKIDNDPVYRAKLYRPMLTVSSQVLPAKYLKSELHRFAFTLAVQLNEVNRELLGNRTRRDYGITE